MATENQGKTGDVYLRARLDIAPLADDANQGKAIVKDFANSVTADTATAGKNLANLGGSANNINRLNFAFEGVTDSVKKMVADSGVGLQAFVKQIQNSAASTGAVTQAIADKFEARAILKGFDPAVVQPYLAGLRQLADENRRVAEVVAYEANEQKKAAIERAKGVSQLNNFALSAQAARLELLSFGKTAAEKYQIRAELLGIDKNKAVQQIIADLKAAEAAALAAGKGVGSGLQQPMEKLGMSAKATSAALRQVPAQFTDIIVSLQGGQAPLTVLLQQGGQLKDVFGGVGAAAQALGKYVVGLISPLSVTAVAIGALGVVAYKASEDAKAFGKALAETGNRSGTSVGQLKEIATAIGATGIGASAASDALTKFVSAGVKAGDNLRSFTQSAIDLERNGGQAVEKTAEKFAELAKEPLSATLKLNESLGYVTQSLYEQIKALERSGDVAGAAALAQGAYEQAIIQQNAALESQRGPIDTATRYWANYFNSLVDGARYATSAILGIPKTGVQQNADDRAKLAEYETRYGPDDKDVIALKEKIRVYDYLVAAQKASTKAEQDRIEVLKLSAKYDASDFSNDKLAKRNLFLIENARLLSAGAIDYTKYTDRVAAFDKANEKSTRTIENAGDSIASYIKQQRDLLTEQLDGDQKLTASDKLRIEGTRKIEDALGKKALTQAQALKLQKDLNTEVERSIEVERIAADARDSKDYAKYLADQDKAIDKIKEDVAQEKLRIEQMGLSKVALADLMALRLEDDAALLERNANRAIALGLEGEDTRLMKEKAQALRELAEARRAGAKKEDDLDLGKAAKKSAEDAVKAWEKAAEKINDSITDALLRGFESGKNFAENLRDTVVNMFKTMVLRPTVSALVSVGAGALGFSSAASAASSVPTLVNIAGIATAATSALGAGFSLALSGGTGLALQGGAAMLSSATGLASATAGLAQIAGALAPWALGAAAIFSLLKGGSYVQSQGETVATVNASNQIALAGSGGTNDRSIGGGLNVRQTELSDKFVGTLASTFVAAASKLGISTAGASFGAGFNDSDGGKFNITSSANGRKFESGQTKYTEASLQLEASRAVFAALQASELPGYLSKVFSGITASTASQQDIDAALAYAGSLKDIREALLETRTPLAILQDSVAAGFAALGTSAATFKTDFVSAIDQGISPDKLAQYLKLGQNLDDLAKATGNASETVVDAARSLADIANERKGLDERFAQATLNTEQLAIRARDAIDASNQARYDEVLAAEAAKTAAEELADAQAEAAAAAEDLANRAKAAFENAIASLSDRNTGLQVRLLNAQGNTAGATKLQRDTDLAKLLEGVTDTGKIAQITEAFNKNSALEDFITALEETNRAAEQAARASEQAAEAASRSAEQIKSAWQSVADSLYNEVKRIRNLMGGSSAQSFAGAQAAFSIAAAQASAGDQDAAKLLPGLSQALLTLAEAQATSLLQLRAIQGQTAGTLEKIGGQYAAQFGLSIPKLATGTNYVPNDMLAMLHQGEAVVPAAYNPSSGGGGSSNQALVDEVKALRQEVAAMRASNEVIAKAATNSDKTLTRVTRGGDNMVTKDYTVA